MINPEEIRKGLEQLEPNIPWAHYFNFGDGIETVLPEEEKFYKKAVGLGKLGNLLLDVVPLNCRRGSIKDLRLLDLASAEGVHSIKMAQSGANVLGIEGRQLYVERAKFAAQVLGVENVSFQQGDVRTVDPSAVGTFEFVLFSGILHHLGQDDFEGMLKTLANLTEDTLFIYTHVSTPESIERFRLTGPVKTQNGYQGYVFREHKDNASQEEKYRKVRASLDNTFSFWATEKSLIDILVAVGFKVISKLIVPHLFGWDEASYRPLFIARR
ncbi:bifunctional 2-polyprenyl-6-hydroxyphenol methylase/3-demethylubiquinol 3-O-methyltransferase UbiG [Calothrix sp. PCC 7507]|uniref:class I SAM-dependent methyltransferase n=1 Tax=Calothrix sp. PCC 7507 TaxID=99598 RepID=UPI0019174EA3|nr:class I SAM-dependent methyltransferase [Calothrix sp. PCC 7507]